MSKSGIDTRSGLRKRSNRRPKRSGIEIGDRQRPGDDRAGARAAPRPDRDALALRPLDEIGDDQEIAGKPGLGRSCRARIRGARDRARRRPHADPGAASRASSPARAAARSAVASSRPVRQSGNAGRIGLLRLRDEGAAPGDHQRVVAGFRQIGEQRPHLRGRAEEMIGRQTPAVVVGDRAALRRCTTARRAPRRNRGRGNRRRWWRRAADRGRRRGRRGPASLRASSGRPCRVSSM